MIYRFGAYRLDEAEHRLTRGGEPVSLTPKVFDTLVALVERAGRLVEKREMLRTVWPEAVVEEGNVAHNVSVLRKALGGGKTDQAYIETVPTRGYRFVADVTVEGEPPEGPERRTEAAALEQRIRVTRASDGARIAYAVAGKGPPLVKAANWLNHLEFDWESPVWRHVMGELASYRTLVRYDERGNGLSDWDVEDLSFEAFVRDLEAVVDAAGLERFALLGISQGCPVSIAYAVRHPERVSRLVLHGGYAVGWKHREDPGEEEMSSARLELELIRTGWGRDTPAFRQAFAAIYIPDATPEQSRSWTELQRVSTTPQNAARLVEAFGEIDVIDLLPRVRVPALVLHSRHDSGVPFEAGRDLAAGIPAARFVPLDSVNHLILDHEPAWPIWRSAVRDFLAAGESSRHEER